MSPRCPVAGGGEDGVEIRRTARGDGVQALEVEIGVGVHDEVVEPRRAAQTIGERRVQHTRSGGLPSPSRTHDETARSITT